MADRSRLRVGRNVRYFPTDAEASSGGGVAGDTWSGKITNVNSDGTVDLAVEQANGQRLAKTGASQGTGVGKFDVYFPDAV